MAKILMLGGCGDMGRMAVVSLLSSPLVEKVTIADKNYEVAQRYVELANSDKLSAVEIDITNEEELIPLISSHDLVANTIGPFYKFGVPVLKAAIKAKRHYVDICDDWKPTLDMLGLNEEAQNAGITAIIGIGASPGITNLLAVKAYSELDEVNKIITAWGIGWTKMGQKPTYFISKKNLFTKQLQGTRTPNAAIMHLLHESIGKIPIYRDGKLVEIESLTEAEPIHFPGRGGPMYACYIGHPEPVTLSRTLKVNSISNQMFLTKKFTDVLRDYVKQISEGNLTMAEAAIAIEDDLNKFTTKLYLLWVILKRFFRFPPTLCAFALGKKGNRIKKVAIGVKYQPYGEIDEGMDGITAIPLVIAALMILKGEISKKGVFTPEETINPDEFFAYYAKFCEETLTMEDVLLKKVIDL